MNEYDYLHTRPELDTALDAEFGSLRSSFNDLWFRQQDLARELSDLITELYRAHRRVSRMLTETVDQAVTELELPTGD